MHVIHDDEAFYAVVAQRWLHGELPYVASYDVKAPGVFAVLAARGDWDSFTVYRRRRH